MREQVLSVGLDGAVSILQLDAQEPASPFVPACASKSHRSAKWSFHDTFVTAGTYGTGYHPPTTCLMQACVGLLLFLPGAAHAVAQPLPYPSSCASTERNIIWYGAHSAWSCFTGPLHEAPH